MTARISKNTLEHLYTVENLTKRQIAKKYKVAFRKVEYLLYKYKIKLKDPMAHQTARPRKHHYLNLDRFDSIQDKDAAYILGYIAWAGYSREDRYILSGRTSQLPCLQKFASILGLRDDNSLRQQELIRRNKRYIKYVLLLSKNGLNKFISKWYYGDPHVRPFKFPPKMDKKYLPDYLRGYLDRHTVVLQCSNGFREALVSTPYKTFSIQLQKALEEFGIHSWVKSRNQVNGKVSYGVYISAKSYVTMHKVFFKSKSSMGTHLELFLRAEKERRLAA